jgi:hypothetical protein
MAKAKKAAKKGGNPFAKAAAAEMPMPMMKGAKAPPFGAKKKAPPFGKKAKK